MENKPSALKISCNPDLLVLIRAILYDANLHWGARVLALTLLDLPLPAKPTNARLAFKLKTSVSQIGVWRRELLRHGLRLRG